ncbi:MAG: Antibiotic biosynthesis monooxygenase [Planctomycetaceae bacterium]|nr:Antibiotic biosynthesis monooxygenase [Planctomycetaceae bacterium]
MIYLNVLLKVKDAANIPVVHDLLIRQGQLSRQEPGCARFEVYQSSNDPTRFFLNERWDTQADLDVHRTAEAYTQIYQPKVIPLVDREGHPSQLLE